MSDNGDHAGAGAAASPDIKDITVIGAGPVGLITAFWAGMREASARIIDSLPEIGGQLTTLYPEKWIFDVPVLLETTAHNVVYEPDPTDPEREVIRLETDAGDLLTRTVVIAGGHGAFEPKRLPGFDMAPWEGRGAHYLVGEKAAFAGKNVVIVGGGDSACDWVVNLLDTAERITLVHRREEFRAHEATVAEVRAAAAAGQVDLRTPYEIKGVEGNGQIERITLSHAEDDSDEVELACDAVLLQLGFKTALGPLKQWPLEIQKGAIVVDALMKTSMDGVWAAGDITTFDGKLKLIATGFAESAIAVAQAVHHIRPEMRLQPKYSTNTGVPGAGGGEA